MSEGGGGGMSSGGGSNRRISPLTLPPDPSGGGGRLMRAGSGDSLDGSRSSLDSSKKGLKLVRVRRFVRLCVYVYRQRVLCVCLSFGGARGVALLVRRPKKNPRPFFSKLTPQTLHHSHNKQIG